MKVRPKEVIASELAEAIKQRQEWAGKYASIKVPLATKATGVTKADRKATQKIKDECQERWAHFANVVMDLEQELFDYEKAVRLHINSATKSR